MYPESSKASELARLPSNGLLRTGLLISHSGQREAARNLGGCRWRKTELSSIIIPVRGKVRHFPTLNVLKKPLANRPSRAEHVDLRTRKSGIWTIESIYRKSRPSEYTTGFPNHTRSGTVISHGSLPPPPLSAEERTRTKH
jgi:hypothetical protein